MIDRIVDFDNLQAVSIGSATPGGRSRLKSRLIQLFSVCALRTVADRILLSPVAVLQEDARYHRSATRRFLRDGDGVI